MARRGDGQQPAVSQQPTAYLHIDLPEWNIDAGAHLTASEARTLAEALTAVADTIEGVVQMFEQPGAAQ
jgi:hypothetical protein